MTTPAPDPQSEPSHPGAPLGWQAPLCDIAYAFAVRKWIVLTLLFLGSAAGAVGYVLTPNYYRASAVAVLMPREKPTLDTSINAGSVRTTDDRASRESTGALMLPPEPDLYMALLQSRPVLEVLVERLSPQLKQLRRGQRSDEEVGDLRKMIRLEATDEGLLTITATAPTAKLAADLANELLAEGRRASKEIERQMLLQQAGFLEDALKSAQARLAKEETDFKDFCARHRLMNPLLQADQNQRLRNQTLAERDRARATLTERTLHFTNADPEVQRLQARVQSTSLRLVEIEQRVIGNQGERDYGGLMTEYEGLQQRLRFSRDILSTIDMQVQLFRIRAEQPAGSIAIVRPATPPTKHAGPSKKRFLGTALGAAVLLASLLVVVSQQWSGTRGDPYIQARLGAIRSALRPIQADKEERA
jgi:tyrosine-protein kinase Etk/Wzc